MLEIEVDVEPKSSEDRIKENGSKPTPGREPPETQGGQKELPREKLPQGDSHALPAPPEQPAGKGSPGLIPTTEHGSLPVSPTTAAVDRQVNETESSSQVG